MGQDKEDKGQIGINGGEDDHERTAKALDKR